MNISDIEYYINKFVFGLKYPDRIAIWVSNESYELLKHQKSNYLVFGYSKILSSEEDNEIVVRYCEKDYTIEKRIIVLTENERIIKNIVE